MFLQFELWKQCSMNCKFCYNNGIKFKRDKMKSMQQALDVTNSEEINKYDQNTICDEQLVNNGDFNSPFNGRVFPQSGDSLSGYYRGITSLAYGESDIFTFYDI